MSRGILKLFSILAALATTAVGSMAGAVPLTIEFDADVGFYDPIQPVGGEHGPYDWLENGARYSGWWLESVGTPAGYAKVGHTHLVGENDSVYPLIGDIQHSWREGHQGTTISMENGLPFDVVSIDIRILSRDTPSFDPYNMQRIPWSFALDDAQLLLSTTPVDPVAANLAAFESQFTAFSIDDGSIRDNGDGTFDPNLPADDLFHTISISGFDNITSFNLSHSAGLVWIDNIVLEVGSVPIPEPGTGLLVGLGLVALGLRSQGRRA